MRVLFVLLSLFLALPEVGAYSYSTAGKEPVMEARKKILIALDQGNKEQALKEVQLVDDELKYLEERYAPGIREKLKGALNSGENSRVLTHLNQLFAAEIKRRVISAGNNINNYQIAKVLLVKTKPFFDILTPFFEKDSASTIQTELKNCLRFIGKPGVFGVGARKPDPVNYKKHMKILIKILDETRF